MEFVTRRPIVLEVYRPVSLRFFDFIFDLKFLNRFRSKRVSKVSFICELSCLRILSGTRRLSIRICKKGEGEKIILIFHLSIRKKKTHCVDRSPATNDETILREIWNDPIHLTLSLSLKIPWNPISRRVNSSLPRTGHERETSYWVQRERGRKREWIRVSTRNRFPRMDHGGVPSVLEGTGAPLPAENTSFLLFIFTNTSPGKGDGSLDGSVMCALYFHSLE